MEKKYELPNEEPQMVGDNVAAYGTASTEHVQMSFDVPRSFDKESFRLLMMVYAERIIKKSAKAGNNRTLTDAQLEEALCSLPDFNESKDSVTPVLTKEDYARFMRNRKPMKGIAKWL